MQYLEASWGADGSGKVAGGYPLWTHVLQGRCNSIGGNPSSSLKLLEMIIRWQLLWVQAIRPWLCF